MQAAIRFTAQIDEWLFRFEHGGKLAHVPDDVGRAVAPEGRAI